MGLVALKLYNMLELLPSKTKLKFMEIYGLYHIIWYLRVKCLDNFNLNRYFFNNVLYTWNGGIQLTDRVTATIAFYHKQPQSRI